MPPKIHTVTVRVRCKPNGGFSVSVDDWKKKMKQSEQPELTWDLQPEMEGGNPTAAVKWMRVENPFSASDWPFAATPPDPTYIATPGNPAKSGPLKAGWGNQAPTTTRYSLTICFADTATGAERYAYIDPDMVIDPT